MVEQIYDTLQALLFLELPKNAQGAPTVYNRLIKGWYFGDRTVVAGTPALIVSAESSSPKDVAQNVLQYEHKINIAVKSGNDNTEISERVTLEMARLVREALLPHRRIWVMTKCPFCLKHILTPAHFIAQHAAIFAPYAAQSLANFSATWYETHAPSDTVPSLPDSGVGADAFQLLCADAVTSTPSAFWTQVNSLITQPMLAALKAIETQEMRPVRLLFDVKFSDIKPSEDSKEQQLLHGSEFSLTASELLRQPAYGPDNVPTDAWN